MKEAERDAVWKVGNYVHLRDEHRRESRAPRSDERDHEGGSTMTTALLATFTPGEHVLVNDSTDELPGTVLGPCPWQTNTYRVAMAGGGTALVNPTRMRRA